MGLNDAPMGKRVHIGFFGKRNAGKSSVVNAVTGQSLSIVSDVKGTTTDPVFKAMELLPLGPAVIIDTPGFDDEGELGRLRIQKTRQILEKTDIAVLVVDAFCGADENDRELIALFKEKDIPYVTVYNKSDIARTSAKDGIAVSAVTGEGIHELKEKIASFANIGEEPRIIGDMLSTDDTVVLVTPIDKAAPKGRLILPQQQTIRDVLDAGAVCIVARETEYASTLKKLVSPPKLVITDSQVFDRVAEETPRNVLLTSFSILMSRAKGFLHEAVRGVTAIDRLTDGDRVLISEGCTHHRQCGDIGTVKIPAMLKKYTGKTFYFETSSGGDFPEDLSRYALVIHCGGCMLRPRAVKGRAAAAESSSVPITNYGTAIAYMHGILERSLEIFPDILAEVKR